MSQIRTATQRVLDEYENDDVILTFLWEVINLKFREQSLKYVADKKVKLNRKEEELERRINILNQIISESKKSGMPPENRKRRKDGKQYVEDKFFFSEDKQKTIT